MQVTLRKKEVGKYKFVVTDICGAEVTLTKDLVTRLRSEGLITSSAVELPEYVRLFGTTKEKFVNLYLGIRKDTASKEDDDDLPF